MNVLFFFIFFLGTSLGAYVLADVLVEKIIIAPEDQTCTQDDECRDIPVDCLTMGCTCVGKPVNKQKYVLYEKKLLDCWDTQRRAGFIQPECKIRCDTKVFQCVQQRCQVILQP